MNMPITLRKDAEKFAEFIVANYDNAKEWEDPVGKAAWYISHAFIAVVCSEQGHIVAVGAARPVDRPGMGVLPYYFNENGRNLHIDLLVDRSSDLRAIIAFRDLCKIRFPRCTTVAMFRHFETNIRVYQIGKFWKSLERIKRRRKEI
jgi:hypothetical protein